MKFRHLTVYQARSRQAQKGASLVEFIVVGPLAILFTMGILQFGFMYMAKLTLNNATFAAARKGAAENAKKNEIESSLMNGLIPFYQNSTNANDVARLAAARLAATLDNTTYRAISLGTPALDLDIVSPNPNNANDPAFQGFGIVETVNGNRIQYIPNDNLEFRNHNILRNGMNIRDANILRIKVTYAYELKVPLMASVVRRVMCSGSSGVNAFGDVSIFNAAASITNCVKYYNHGRVPIVSYATVQMQSRAERPAR